MPLGPKVIKGDSAALAESLQDRQERPASVRIGRPGVMSSEVYDAKQTRAGILSDAQAEAEHIRQDAERQKQEVLDAAREEGRQEGLAMVSEELARAKIRAGEMLRQNEPAVIELACKLAEKIIGRELERDPAALVELCATAIENVRSAKALVLKVNPQTAARLRTVKKDLMDLIGRSVDLAIKEDPDIGDMGCIIQTEFGTVDARIGTQLKILETVLLDPGNKDSEPA